MYDVSAAYKTAATANGRSPLCVISAGGQTFTDTEIISFDFDDVVHAEDMNFGSSCANRLNFVVYSEDYIPLSSVVRAYVGFSDSAELCPLGEFYITYRYRKKGKLSITCYDRMYLLDNAYTSELQFPAPMSDVLGEICRNNGITADIDTRGLICGYPPDGITVRDAIGYIAGALGGCAKFDRGGVLVVKKMRECGETILRDNYTDLRLKQDSCEFRQVTLKTDNEVFTVGNGTSLTEYYQYNPFGSQLSANYIYADFSDFLYYGGEISMQGIPYFEAGDGISVQNDADNSVFPIVISEMLLSYNGKLSGTIISRSKNPVDAYETVSKEEQKLASLYSNLAIAYYVHKNDQALTIAAAPTLLCTIVFEAMLCTCVLINANLTLSPSEDCGITFSYKINDGFLPQTPSSSLKAGETVNLCLHTYCDTVVAGTNTLSLYAETSACAAFIDAEQFVLTLTGQYLQTGISAKYPNISRAEIIPLTNIGFPPLSIAVDDNGIYSADACLTLSPCISQGMEYSQLTYPAISLAQMNDLILWKDIYSVTVNGTDGMTVIFANPVSSADISLLSGAFVIGKASGGTMVYSNAVSVSQTDANTLALVTQDFSDCDGGLTLSYSASAGNLVSAYTGQSVQSFNLDVDYGL